VRIEILVFDAGQRTFISTSGLTRASWIRSPSMRIDLRLCPPACKIFADKPGLALLGKYGITRSTGPVEIVEFICHNGHICAIPVGTLRQSVTIFFVFNRLLPLMIFYCRQGQNKICRLSSGQGGHLNTLEPSVFPHTPGEEPSPCFGCALGGCPGHRAFD
jgi:hypothetical protein